MAAERWTTETEDTARAAALRSLQSLNVMSTGFVGYKRVWQTDRTPTELVRDILAALADAGLLVEPGGETREEWGTAVYRDGTELVGGPGPASSEMAADARVAAHDDAREADPTWRGSARKLRRTVHVGPWREVQ